MSNMSDDIQYASSDTRPPMLDRTDYESWQQCIRLYCLGKDNRENIMKSIVEGPYQMGTKTVTLAGGVEGLPKDIYALINHYTDVKDIWDNVKMLLDGSNLTKDDRESQLYDDFEHFRQNKGENIHNYYLRFNTEAKLNSGLRKSNFDQLYAYLKQHEVHATENKLMLETFTQEGRVAVQDVRGRYNANNQGRQFQRNNARGFVGTGNAEGQNRVRNLNPGRAKPIKCYNYNGIGHIAQECPQPKRPRDSDYFKDKMMLMQAQENGASKIWHSMWTMSLKLVLCVYLWHPKTMGTKSIYQSFVKPYLSKHEAEIDCTLMELKTRAGDSATLYCSRVLVYGQIRAFEILQMVMATAAPQESNQTAAARSSAVNTDDAARNRLKKTGATLAQ
nr:putative HVA22-like protein g [Tanacetum cinerariifolium]